MLRTLVEKNGKQAPFFISLLMNEFTLYNCMLDSSASMNIVPLKVMQQLVLEISQPYQNVCGVDSKPITVCSLIKYVRVSSVAFPYISLVMNVVVIDILDVWGMLLSREWAQTLGGNLQMELSYATIPRPEGGFITLYREPIVRYRVESPKGPMDKVFYSDEKMGNLYAIDPTLHVEKFQDDNGMWTLELNGAHSSSSSGPGIVLTSPSREATYFSYRIEYDCTKNVVEYKALIIGLNLSLDRNIRRLKVIGDYDLIVSQVNLKFSTKNEILRRHKDLVNDTIIFF
jgi:hypothetical protein